MNKNLRGMATAVFATLVLSACGGGGGGGAAGGTGGGAAAGGAGATVSLTGLVAGGAPLIGSVSARDSLGTTFGPVQTSVTGTYNLDLSTGTAPFILQATGTVAGKPVTYYSSTSANSGQLNITPFTDMIVAQAANASPATIFTNCTSAVNCTLPPAIAMTTAQNNVQGSLANLLALFHAQGTDLMTGTFVAGAVLGQSPIDVLLDSITVAPVNGTPGSFTLTANPNTTLPANTVLATLPAVATTAPLAINPALTPTIVSNINTTALALTAIQTQLTIFQNRFATVLPAANDPALVALFDASFMDNGDNSAAFLAQMTTSSVYSNPFPIGGTFSAPLNIPSPDGAFPNDATHQWFSTRVTTQGVGFSGVLRMLAVKNAAGTWLVAGNQRQVGVGATYQASQTVYPAAGIAPILNASGVQVNVTVLPNTPPLISTWMNFSVFATPPPTSAVPATSGVPAISPWDATVIAKGVQTVTVSGPGIIDAVGVPGAATIFSSVATAPAVVGAPAVAGSQFLQQCLPAAVTTNCWDQALLTPGVYTFTVTGTTPASGVPFSYVYSESSNATSIVNPANFPVLNTPLNLGMFTSGAVIPMRWTVAAGQIQDWLGAWGYDMLSATTLFSAWGCPNCTVLGAPISGLGTIIPATLTLPVFPVGSGAVNIASVQSSTFDPTGNAWYGTMYQY